MALRPSDRPSIQPSGVNFHIFEFSSENHWTDCNVLFYGCVFSDRSEKQDGQPGLWFAETYSTSPRKLLNGIQRNFTGSNLSMSSITKFVFFWLIRKTSWLPLPLIDWDIFDFFFGIAEQNSTKLDRSQIAMPSDKFVFSGRSEWQSLWR